MLILEVYVCKESGSEESLCPHFHLFLHPQAKDPQVLAWAMSNRWENFGIDVSIFIKQLQSNQFTDYTVQSANAMLQHIPPQK